MIQHAEAVNARLLKVFPKGFALGATHHPHISILQRYVHTADLDKVYDAVGKVLADKKAAGWSLKAFKYYYIPWKDIGLAGIVVEPNRNAADPESPKALKTHAIQTAPAREI